MSIDSLWKGRAKILPELARAGAPARPGGRGCSRSASVCPTPPDHAWSRFPAPWHRPCIFRPSVRGRL